MTLITYPTRVHFADAVLADALHSEIESMALLAPLLIVPDAPGAAESREVILSGLPVATDILSFDLAETADLSTAAVALCEQFAGQRVDTIIAFGAARAIELGRKARKMLSQFGPRPKLYAVPGIDGLPDPCRRNVESWRSGLPDVLICDPTLILSAGPEDNLRSALRSLVRSLESYLASTYNPTADGMALDAFSRSVANLPRLAAAPDVTVSRELMAAGLNAALSQQKGLGPAQMLAVVLAAQHSGLDALAAARLLLPGALAAMEAEVERTDLLGRMIGAGADRREGAATERLSAYLGAIPSLAPRLSDLGLTPDDLDEAVSEAERADILPKGAARTVLEGVF